jgi:hypothetical protein
MFVIMFQVEKEPQPHHTHRNDHLELQASTTHYMYPMTSLEKTGHGKWVAA